MHWVFPSGQSLLAIWWYLVDLASLSPEGLFFGNRPDERSGHWLVVDSLALVGGLLARSTAGFPSCRARLASWILHMS